MFSTSSITASYPLDNYCSDDRKVILTKELYAYKHNEDPLRR